MSKLFTRVSALDDNVNKMVTKLVTNFDITGEGTILGAGTSTSASTQSAPSTPAGPSVPPPEEQPRKAKTPQQCAHARARPQPCAYRPACMPTARL